MRVVLPITGPYTNKDQSKSDLATKFIGRGSPASSTAKYAAAWGDRANCGVYSRDDVVFVSAEGARTNRVPLDYEEIAKAAKARVTFITDTAFHRNRPYNIGEREAVLAIASWGYAESAPGIWHPKT